MTLDEEWRIVAIGLIRQFKPRTVNRFTSIPECVDEFERRRIMISSEPDLWALIDVTPSDAEIETACRRDCPIVFVPYEGTASEWLRKFARYAVVTSAVEITQLAMRWRALEQLAHFTRNLLVLR